MLISFFGFLLVLGAYLVEQDAAVRHPAGDGDIVQANYRHAVKRAAVDVRGGDTVRRRDRNTVSGMFVPLFQLSFNASEQVSAV